MKSRIIDKLRSTGLKKALRIEAAIILALLLGVAATVYSAVAEQRSIADKLVRLHISAASDGEKDQADKLAVRDRLIEELSDELSELKTADEALSHLEERLPAIEDIARSELNERGVFCDVSAAIDVEYFPERDYEGMSLPAGEYTSLRIKIGGGNGANWWCVMFPPLCTSSATVEDGGKAYAFSGGEWRTITQKSPKIRVKFKILEVFSSVKRWFDK